MHYIQNLGHIFQVSTENDLQSKLLKGGYIWDYIGDYYRFY